MNLHRFTVSLDADDAINSASLAEQYKDKDLGQALRKRNVFDTLDEADARLAELIEQAEADGTCEPGHECGRCRNWPPKVYEVIVKVTECST